jgi:hypothetical protein
VTVRYPQIEVDTAGCGGNRLAVLGRVLAAMNLHGVPPGEIAEFQRQVNAKPATFGDLIAVAALWVTLRQP